MLEYPKKTTPQRLYIAPLSPIRGKPLPHLHHTHAQLDSPDSEKGDISTFRPCRLLTINSVFPLDIQRVATCIFTRRKVYAILFAFPLLFPAYLCIFYIYLL